MLSVLWPNFCGQLLCLPFGAFHVFRVSRYYWIRMHESHQSDLSNPSTLQIWQCKLQAFNETSAKNFLDFIPSSSSEDLPVDADSIMKVTPLFKLQIINLGLEVTHKPRDESSKVQRRLFTTCSYPKSIPMTTSSTLSSSNFSRHVLRLCLQPVRTFNHIIFCPLIFTVWVSSRIWTAWSSILGCNRWISNHPPLFKSLSCCSYPTVVVTQYWTNNFSRPCRNT